MPSGLGAIRRGASVLAVSVRHGCASSRASHCRAVSSLSWVPSTDNRAKRSSATLLMPNRGLISGMSGIPGTLDREQIVYIDDESTASSLPFQKIAIIGAGVMSNVIVARLVESLGAKCPPIFLYDVEPKQSAKMAEEFEQVTAVAQSCEVFQDADLILLAVKPQNIASVAAEMKNSRDCVPKDALVLSILAGTPTITIQKALGMRRIVRAMPNTPCALGMGITVWVSTADVDDTQVVGIEGVFGVMGESVRVRDEKFLDMATALAGSGPAYVYLAMEAMVDAGVQMGFPRDTAVQLVQNTFQGAGAYAMHSTRHLAQLRNDITSPGGTTATALYTLERGGLRTTLSDAVFAAHRKAVELGKGKNPLPDAMGSGLSDDSF